MHLSLIHISGGNEKALWDAARTALQKTNPTLAVLALKAADWQRDGDTLIVRFEKKPFYDAFVKPENFKLAAEALAGTAGGMKLRVAMAGEDAGNSPSLEEAARKAFGDMLEIVE